MLLISSGALLLVGMALLTLFGGRSTTQQARPSIVQPFPVLREIRDFSLTNQAGSNLLRTDLLGRPWAINLIFTRCPGPCAQLSGVMRSVQSGLPPGSQSRLLSLTSDPEHDVPRVLAAYSEKIGADGRLWQFGTGARLEIQRLATEDLMLVLVEKPEAERESPDDLFLHSTLIVLVDRRGRVRTVVEGLEPGAAGRVLDGLAQLELEPER